MKLLPFTRALASVYPTYKASKAGDLSDEELRVMALEACNALENQASYIRQVFFLERPTQQIVMMNGQNYGESQPELKPQPEPEPEQYRGIQIKGVGTLEDMDAVFGDM